MKSPLEVFMEDILANPYDDVPRLILADWLEENGQADRGQFIRAQIQLAINYNGNDQHIAMTHLPKTRSVWLPQGVTHEQNPIWRRGFIESIVCHTVSETLTILGRLPLIGLRLYTAATQQEVARLACHPAWVNIRDLCMYIRSSVDIRPLFTGKRRMRITLRCPVRARNVNQLLVAAMRSGVYLIDMTGDSEDAAGGLTDGEIKDIILHRSNRIGLLPHGWEPLD